MGYTSFRPADLTFNPLDAAYTANDVVGGLLEFTMPSVRGIIYGFQVAIGEASIAVPGALYFYDSAPTTTFADGDAFAPVHADNKKMIGFATLPTAVALNSRNIYNLSLENSEFNPILYWTSKVYCYYPTSGTPNFTGAAQEIQIRLFCMGEW